MHHSVGLSFLNKELHSVQYLEPKTKTYYPGSILLGMLVMMVLISTT